MKQKLMLLFVCVILFFETSHAQNQAALDKVNEISVRCPAGKDPTQCLSHQESLYKKLGCQMEKRICGPVISETKAGRKKASVCLYKSANCAVSSNKSCGDGYNARWLDGVGSKAICVLAPDAASGDRSGPAVIR